MKKVFVKCITYICYTVTMLLATLCIIATLLGDGKLGLFDLF